ncbi:hypothetical protein RB653_003804 [Dictyostelium firmibasis]|uniref:Adenylate kinase active site lid domain-containing protein n=1 Tax=Dictyostelium firmibasis TaxID=79012 RepID=A0AAN7U6C4_9MYCE
MLKTLNVFKTVSLRNYYSTTTIKAKDGLRMTIIGAPGSGKGTQSEKLKRDYNVTPISTGQILREVSEEDSPLGKSIKSKLAAGELISDDIMLNIIENALNVKSNWLLDGYPRNPEQAKHLDKFLKERGIPLNLVLYLDVPEKVLAERVQDRWVHPGSGRVYNSLFSPPKVKGVDDITGEPLVRRSDDKDEEVFKNRIQTFKQNTFPLLKYYNDMGILYTIDSPNSDDGYVKIKHVLEEVIKK